VITNYEDRLLSCLSVGTTAGREPHSRHSAR